MKNINQKTKIINLNNPFIKKNKKNDIGSLIIGQFELIHKSHVQLIKKTDNFSFLIFKNNPGKKNFLFSMENKIENLKKFNPKYIFVYDIGKNEIEAKEFMNIFLDKLNPSSIIVGSDFRFGKDRKGDVNTLQTKYNVEIIPRNEKFSSRNIFDLLKEGKIDVANKLLFQPVIFENKVVKGQQLARELGFPTANIILKKNIPLMYGSYISEIEFENKTYYGLSFYGNTKTLGRKQIYLETYIYNFNQDIYGKIIKVKLLKFIRGLETFRGKDQLVKAIKKDFIKMKKYFKIA